MKTREQEFEKRAIHDVQRAGGECHCGDGMFCNNDYGPNMGFCEACGNFKGSDDCYNAGLPIPGAIECDMRCYGTSPDEAQTKASAWITVQETQAA